MAWLTSTMDKQINQVIQYFDCDIALHRRVDYTIIAADQDQSKSCLLQLLQF